MDLVIAVNTYAYSGYDHPDDDIVGMVDVDVHP